MTMNLTALKAEITTDPKAKGYAAYLPKDPVHAVDLINAKTETMVKARFVTSRTILAEVSGGGTIMKALEKAAVPPVSATAQQTEVAASVEYALKFLNQDSGLDVGHPNTQGLIDALVTATSLTSAQGTALKNMAIQAANRSEVIGCGPSVTVQDLRDAGVI